MKVVINDGGRAAAGFKGMARGDCVARSIAIVAQLPYQEVYDALADINARTPASKRRKAHKVGRRTASDGIYTNSVLFKRYMASLGFVWTPTMGIGTGCKVHLADGELPMGRIIARLTRHYTAVIDGVIHDTHDPQRDVHCIEPDRGQDLKRGQWCNENGICSISRRCVYGYWSLI